MQGSYKYAHFSASSLSLSLSSLITASAFCQLTLSSTFKCLLTPILEWCLRIVCSTRYLLEISGLALS